MYPLLVSGITSVATRLIDSWSQAGERKAETERVKFQEVLDRVVGPAKTAGAGAVTKAVSPIEARIEELRAALLDSPEVRSYLETADPTKSATLQLDENGQMTIQTPNGWPRTLPVSSDAQNQARELSRLLAMRPVVTGITSAMSFSR